MLDPDDPAGWPTFVFQRVQETQECPKCGAVGPQSPRHSPYICRKCSEDIVDADGDRVVFADISSYRKAKSDPEDKSSWMTHTWKEPFYLDNRRVQVYEGRFGGHVVQYLTTEELDELGD